MEQKNLERIAKLVQRWGVPMQVGMTMEESAELITVCSHLLRGGVQRNVLVDAIGDAYVMLQTLVQIYDIKGEELEAVATEKLLAGLAKSGLSDDTPFVPYEEAPADGQPAEQENISVEAADGEEKADEEQPAKSNKGKKAKKEALEEE